MHSMTHREWTEATNTFASASATSEKNVHGDIEHLPNGAIDPKSPHVKISAGAMDPVTGAPSRYSNIATEENKSILPSEAQAAEAARHLHTAFSNADEPHGSSVIGSVIAAATDIRSQQARVTPEAARAYRNLTVSPGRDAQVTNNDRAFIYHGAAKDLRQNALQIRDLPEGSLELTPETLAVAKAATNLRESLKQDPTIPNTRYTRNSLMSDVVDHVTKSVINKREGEKQPTIDPGKPELAQALAHPAVEPLRQSIEHLHDRADVYSAEHNHKLSLELGTDAKPAQLKQEVASSRYTGVSLKTLRENIPNVGVTVDPATQIPSISPETSSLMESLGTIATHGGAKNGQIEKDPNTKNLAEAITNYSRNLSGTGNQAPSQDTLRAHVRMATEEGLTTLPAENAPRTPEFRGLVDAVAATRASINPNLKNQAPEMDPTKIKTYPGVAEPEAPSRTGYHSDPAQKELKGKTQGMTVDTPPDKRPLDPGALTRNLILSLPSQNLAETHVSEGSKDNFTVVTDDNGAGSVYGHYISRVAKILDEPGKLKSMQAKDWAELSKSVQKELAIPATKDIAQSNTYSVGATPLAAELLSNPRNMREFMDSATTRDNSPAPGTASARPRSKLMEQAVNRSDIMEAVLRETGGTSGIFGGARQSLMAATENGSDIVGIGKTVNQSFSMGGGSGKNIDAKNIADALKNNKPEEHKEFFGVAHALGYTRDEHATTSLESAAQMMSIASHYATARDAFPDTLKRNFAAALQRPTTENQDASRKETRQATITTHYAQSADATAASNPSAYQSMVRGWYAAVRTKDEDKAQHPVHGLTNVLDHALVENGGPSVEGRSATAKSTRYEVMAHFETGRDIFKLGQAINNAFDGDKRARTSEEISAARTAAKTPNAPEREAAAGRKIEAALADAGINSITLGDHNAMASVASHYSAATVEKGANTIFRSALSKAEKDVNTITPDGRSAHAVAREDRTNSVRKITAMQDQVISNAGVRLDGEDGKTALTEINKNHVEKHMDWMKSANAATVSEGLIAAYNEQRGPKKRGKVNTGARQITGDIADVPANPKTSQVGTLNTTGIRTIQERPSTLAHLAVAAKIDGIEGQIAGQYASEHGQKTISDFLENRENQHHPLVTTTPQMSDFSQVLEQQARAKGYEVFHGNIYATRVSYDVTRAEHNPADGNGKEAFSYETRTNSERQSHITYRDPLTGNEVPFKPSSLTARTNSFDSETKAPRKRLFILDAIPPGEEHRFSNEGLVRPSNDSQRQRVDAASTALSGNLTVIGDVGRVSDPLPWEIAAKHRELHHDFPKSIGIDRHELVAQHLYTNKLLSSGRGADQNHIAVTLAPEGSSDESAIVDVAKKLNFKIVDQKESAKIDLKETQRPSLGQNTLFLLGRPAEEMEKEGMPSTRERERQLQKTFKWMTRDTFISPANQRAVLVPDAEPPVMIATNGKTMERDKARMVENGYNNHVDIIRAEKLEDMNIFTAGEPKTKGALMEILTQGRNRNVSPTLMPDGRPATVTQVADAIMAGMNNEESRSKTSYGIDAVIRSNEHVTAKRGNSPRTPGNPGEELAQAYEVLPSKTIRNLAAEAGNIKDSAKEAEKTGYDYERSNAGPKLSRIANVDPAKPAYTIIAGNEAVTPSREKQLFAAVDQLHEKHGTDEAGVGNFTLHVGTNPTGVHLLEHAITSKTPTVLHMLEDPREDHGGFTGVKDTAVKLAKTNADLGMGGLIAYTDDSHLHRFERNPKIAEIYTGKGNSTESSEKLLRFNAEGRPPHMTEQRHEEAFVDAAREAQKISPNRLVVMGLDLLRDKTIANLITDREQATSPEKLGSQINKNARESQNKPEIKSRLNEIAAAHGIPATEAPKAMFKAMEESHLKPELPTLFFNNEHMPVQDMGTLGEHLRKAKEAGFKVITTQKEYSSELRNGNTVLDSTSGLYRSPTFYENLKNIHEQTAMPPLAALAYSTGTLDKMDFKGKGADEIGNTLASQAKKEIGNNVSADDPKSMTAMLSRVTGGNTFLNGKIKTAIANTPDNLREGKTATVDVSDNPSLTTYETAIRAKGYNITANPDEVKRQRKLGAVVVKAPQELADEAHANPQKVTEWAKTIPAGENPDKEPSRANGVTKINTAAIKTAEVLRSTPEGMRSNNPNAPTPTPTTTEQKTHAERQAESLMERHVRASREAGAEPVISLARLHPSLKDDTEAALKPYAEKFNIKIDKTGKEPETSATMHPMVMTAAPLKLSRTTEEDVARNMRNHGDAFIVAGVSSKDEQLAIAGDATRHGIPVGVLPPSDHASMATARETQAHAALTEKNYPIARTMDLAGEQNPTQIPGASFEKGKGNTAEANPLLVREVTHTGPGSISLDRPEAFARLAAMTEAQISQSLEPRKIEIKVEKAPEIQKTEQKTAQVEQHPKESTVQAHQNPEPEMPKTELSASTRPWNIRIDSDPSKSARIAFIGGREAGENDTMRKQISEHMEAVAKNEPNTIIQIPLADSGPNHLAAHAAMDNNLPVILFTSRRGSELTPNEKALTDRFNSGEQKKENDIAGDGKKTLQATPEMKASLENRIGEQTPAATVERSNNRQGGLVTVPRISERTANETENTFALATAHGVIASHLNLTDPAVAQIAEKGRDTPVGVMPPSTSDAKNAMGSNLLVHEKQEIQSYWPKDKSSEPVTVLTGRDLDPNPNQRAQQTSTMLIRQNTGNGANVLPTPLSTSAFVENISEHVRNPEMQRDLRTMQHENGRQMPLEDSSLTVRYGTLEALSRPGSGKERADILDPEKASMAELSPRQKKLLEFTRATIELKETKNPSIAPEIIVPLRAKENNAEQSAQMAKDVKNVQKAETASEVRRTRTKERDGGIGM